MADPFPHRMTIGDKYGPAMEITEQVDADEYFERCVAHSMLHGLDRAKAEECERSNLGYYAGYYSREVRARVERLYRCEHPVFGSIEKNGAPTPERALEAGLTAGRGQS
jgi:hypothetical protein